jgi:hypothetical protein
LDFDAIHDSCRGEGEVVTGCFGWADLFIGRQSGCGQETEYKNIPHETSF